MAGVIGGELEKKTRETIGRTGVKTVPPDENSKFSTVVFNGFEDVDITVVRQEENFASHDLLITYALSDKAKADYEKQLGINGFNDLFVIEHDPDNHVVTVAPRPEVELLPAEILVSATMFMHIHEIHQRYAAVAKSRSRKFVTDKAIEVHLVDIGGLGATENTTFTVEKRKGMAQTEAALGQSCNSAQKRLGKEIGAVVADLITQVTWVFVTNAGTHNLVQIYQGAIKQIVGIAQASLQDQKNVLPTRERCDPNAQPNAVAAIPTPAAEGGIHRPSRVVRTASLTWGTEPQVGGHQLDPHRPLVKNPNSRPTEPPAGVVAKKPVPSARAQQSVNSNADKRPAPRAPRDPRRSGSTRSPKPRSDR